MLKGNKQKRSRAQKLLIILIAEFFIFAIMTNFGSILSAYEVMKGVDPKFIILLPLVQLVSYLFIAGYYKSMFSVFGKKLKYWDSYRMTAGLYFVEQILPSGGASGIAYLAYGLKGKSSTSLTTLVQLGRYGFNHLAYSLMLVIGVFWSLPLGDSTVTIFGSTMAIGVLISAGIAFYLVLSGDKHVNAIVGKVSSAVNWFGRKILRKKQLMNPKNIIRSLKDFHDGTAKMKEDKTQFIKPFLIMCLSAAVQILVVYLSFVALDKQINLGIVIFAFTFANFFGVLSVVPGDVGVHESAMISALKIMGVDFSVALSATLIYRVFNKFIMVGIGFFFYSHFLKPSEGNEVDKPKKA